MPYNYNPLWKTMKKLNLSTYYLIKNGVNPRTIYKLKHNLNVNLQTLEQICQLLEECAIEEVVEISFPKEKE
ncbi:XRE family transcriptional regulator [Clostridiales bacterium COT073_COT-073]|nr:XRE family transcriptional regulator [Clostridiales bacterium COT073_COT-073]